MKAALLVLLSAGPVAAACPEARVDLRGVGLRESFAVEVADDAAERARGLMQRPDLAMDRGMLFVYPEAGTRTFWMKDTMIPLDIIFADAAGVVTQVQPEAVPYDLTPIPGGDGVQFVLEINGGLAERLGIVPGVQLRHHAIADGAAWPCG